MGRASTSQKMHRLSELLGRLKSGDSFTASSLALDLGISTRTLMRDLETLKEQGYPIEADKGRGGGIRLYPRWGIGRLALNYREVIDLLLSLSVLEKMQSPLFFQHLKSVKSKLFASFPDALRPGIRQIRDRILVGEIASETVQQSYDSAFDQKYTHKLLEAFFEKKQVDITYQRADGNTSRRIVEIHFLFINWPVWYLIAWDHYRQAPRTFRLDRILKATLKPESFHLKSLSTFSEELAQFSRPL